MWRTTAIEWALAHRLTLIPMVVAIDAAAWAALIYFGWHYFNCGG